MSQLTDLLRASHRGGWPYRHPPNVAFKKNENSILSPGVVLLLPTVRGGGNLLRDYSGLNNNGVFPGGTADPDWITSDRGYVLDFDGTDDKVTIPSPAKLPIGASPRTISLTLKNDFAAESDWFFYGAGATGQAFGIDGNGDDDIQVFTWGDDFIFNSGIANDTWFDLVITYDGNVTILAYVNGILKHTKTLGSSRNTAQSDVTLATRTGGSGFMQGTISELVIWDRALSGYEVMYKHQNPWNLIAPEIPIFYSIPPAVGVVNLTVQDGEHTHSGDSPHLSQDQFLTAQDGEHTHSGDSPHLSQDQFLSVADGEHTHTADNVVLVTTIILVVQDGVHTQTADSPHLSQDQFLTAQDGEHTHSGDSPHLSQDQFLTAQDGQHTQTADSPHLSQNQFLVIQDGEHTHTADNVVLVYGVTHILVVQDGQHTHTADSPHLSQDQFIIVQDGEHQHIADGIILVGEDVLLVRPRANWPFWS